MDGKLVDQMYNYAGAWTPGAYEKRSEYGVEMEGELFDEYDCTHWEQAPTARNNFPYCTNDVGNIT